MGEALLGLGRPRDGVGVKDGLVCQGAGELAELKRLYPDALWVLFQDRLINLTAWYYNHPGGMGPFDNHMHKDVYPFFNKISNHYEDGVMKKHVMDKVEGLMVGHIY